MPSNEQTSAMPLPKLLYDLLHDAETLLFQQAALLRAEMSATIAQLLRGSVLVLVGLEIGVAGLGVLIAAFTIVAAQMMPLWLACILAGTATLGAAFILIAMGWRRIENAGFVPRRTRRVWQQTKNWFEDELT